MLSNCLWKCSPPSTIVCNRAPPFDTTIEWGIKHSLLPFTHAQIDILQIDSQELTHTFISWSLHSIHHIHHTSFLFGPFHPKLIAHIDNLIVDPSGKEQYDDLSLTQVDRCCFLCNWLIYGKKIGKYFFSASWHQDLSQNFLVLPCSALFDLVWHSWLLWWLSTIYLLSMNP